MKSNEKWVSGFLPCRAVLECPVCDDCTDEIAIAMPNVRRLACLIAHCTLVAKYNAKNPPADCTLTVDLCGSDAFDFVQAELANRVRLISKYREYNYCTEYFQKVVRAFNTAYTEYRLVAFREQYDILNALVHWTVQYPPRH